MKKMKYLILGILPFLFSIFLIQNTYAAGGCFKLEYELYTNKSGSMQPSSEMAYTPEFCVTDLNADGSLSNTSNLSAPKIDSNSKISGIADVHFDQGNPAVLRLNFPGDVGNMRNREIKVENGKVYARYPNNHMSNLDQWTEINLGQGTAWEALKEQVFGWYCNGAGGEAVNADTMAGCATKVLNINALDAHMHAIVDNSIAAGSNSIDPLNPNPDSGDSSGGTNPGDPCYESGIDSMGWLVCPAIENTKNTIGAVEGLLRSWLEIDPGKIFKEGATDTAWGVFRNVANILITIFLIVIIFSQITGYGIDNYGIKKALPRLIVVAILINFSYIICRLAVDVSNILGVGLSDLFKNIAEGININGATATVATIVDALLGILIGAGGAIGTGITIASTIAGGGGTLLVISLVLTLLVALVAVLMFFVMLAARMLIVIFCTIISPVAFACYLLPNTQTFFKKWWDIFKASLVVFPICGALYGGSELVKAIVLNGDIDFFWALVGIVAPFLPFFALPALLKSALAGITAVGGAISAISSGARNSLMNSNKAIQNTEAFKQQQRENDIRRNERALAKLTNNEGENATKSVTERALRDDLSDKKKHRAGVIRARLMKYDDEDRNMQRFSDDANYTNYLAGREAKFHSENVSNIESSARNGQQTLDDGTIVNANDEVITGQWHRENLIHAAEADNEVKAAEQALHQATANKDKAAMKDAQSKLDAAKAKKESAMSKVEAAQNILTLSQGGRAQVEGNISAMAASGDAGYFATAQSAARQIMGQHAQTYKSAGQGQFAMMADIAKGDTSAVNKINNNEYATAGLSKYSERTLAGADNNTLDGIVDAVNGASSVDDLKKFMSIQDTAANALEAGDQGRIDLNSQARQRLEKIAQYRSVYEDASHQQYTIYRFNGSSKFYNKDGNEIDVSGLKKIK